MEYIRVCPNCNKLIKYSGYKAHYSAKRRNSVCRSCRTRIANKSVKRNCKLENNPAWKGFMGMPYNWFSKYFERRNRKRTGTISIEDCYSLYQQQRGKCALTGLPLTWGPLENDTFDISIDRIDSKKEYTHDNIQLVHKDINLMKNRFDQDYFVMMCRLVAQTK